MTNFGMMVSSLKQNIARAVVGKDDVVELMLTALLCEGHVLIEDVPGVGKTTLANALRCGRDYIIPEDVQHLAPSVLCHRLSLSAEARMRGYTSEQAFGEILAAVRIPVRLK